ncbi:MAG TPA: GerMN domain-containing protein [Candidatus Humimicrobiaceae bacterium]
MNSANKQVKKRKKGPNPIVRFTLIVILLVTVGFFIFYSIDNPDFIKSKFSSPSDENQVEEGETVLLDTGENDAVDATEESVQADDSGESGEENITESETTSDEVSDNNKTTTSLSLWQRIKNFFLGLTGGSEEKETYDDTLKINFYFSELGEDKKMVSEKRTINAGSPENAVKNAIQELLNGPSKSYHFPVIPAGTELLDAETYENTAKIDLSQEFLENSLDTRILDEFIIYSIVNTLTEIPEIEGVIFYIEGIRIKVFGNVDLSIPAIRNTEYIKEEQTDEEQLNEDQSDENQSDEDQLGEE